MYDIRVLLKSDRASDDEKWWSEPATITLRTKATGMVIYKKLYNYFNSFFLVCFIKKK